MPVRAYNRGVTFTFSDASQCLPAGISIVASSILTPKCHRPSPGQKFSNGDVKAPDSSLWLRSAHATCVRAEVWVVSTAHHCSVPTISFEGPWGTGGWTMVKSRPTYLTQEVENGNLGTSGSVLKEAWKKGVMLAVASAASPSVSCGKTFTCLAPFGRSFHSKRAMCLGMFQSEIQISKLFHSGYT